MSAPHLQLYALPEYEPPLCLVPPDPDQPPPGWTPPSPVVLPPIPDRPVWDEPGPLRDQFHQLIRLVLEVLDGRRPLTQLRGTITGPVYTALFTRCRHSTGHHRLHTLRTCRPSPTAVELCATVRVLTPPKRPTVIALAARLELRHNRWICTLLRPLYPNPRPHR
jgi:hypothetical protein